jgi:hypothetical protein
MGNFLKFIVFCLLCEFHLYCLALTLLTVGTISVYLVKQRELKKKRGKHALLHIR